MDVFCAPGIKSRDDRGKLVISVGIRKLVPAQSVTVVIIFPIRIGLPEIQLGLPNRLSIRGKNIPAQDKFCSWHTRFKEGGFFG